MTTHWEPTQFPPVVQAHFVVCSPCPHTLEWMAAAPDDLVVSALGTHFTFGRWFTAGGAPPNHGLAFGLGDHDFGLAYGAWGPDALAIRLRNDLLEMWPLDKYPVAR